jgi:hypothetical protein
MASVGLASAGLFRRRAGAISFPLSVVAHGATFITA